MHLYKFVECCYSMRVTLWHCVTVTNIQEKNTANQNVFKLIDTFQKKTYITSIDKNSTYTTTTTAAAKNHIHTRTLYGMNHMHNFISKRKKKIISSINSKCICWCNLSKHSRIRLYKYTNKKREIRRRSRKNTDRTND